MIDEECERVLQRAAAKMADDMMSVLCGCEAFKKPNPTALRLTPSGGFEGVELRGDGSIIEPPKIGRGELCTYCNRALEARGAPSRLAATRDHTLPKSRGGRFTVWACRHCNELKGDMHPEDWEAFMQSYPEWWRNPHFKNVGKHGSAKSAHGVCPVMEVVATELAQSRYRRLGVYRNGAEGARPDQEMRDDHVAS